MPPVLPTPLSEIVVDPTAVTAASPVEAVDVPTCATLVHLTLAHNKALAAQFLVALDPTAQRFTFQFFSDGDDGYAEIFHGSLDEVWPKVLSLNTPEAAHRRIRHHQRNRFQRTPRRKHRPCAGSFC